MLLDKVVSPKGNRQRTIQRPTMTYPVQRFLRHPPFFYTSVRSYPVLWHQFMWSVRINFRDALPTLSSCPHSFLRSYSLLPPLPPFLHPNIHRCFAWNRRDEIQSEIWQVRRAFKLLNCSGTIRRLGCPSPVMCGPSA